MDGEQLDAICRWLAVFGQGDSSFVDNPTDLLDGQVLAKVYNELAGEADQIDVNALKPIKDGNDWVSMLLNMRQISGKIMPTCKPIEINFEITSLVKNKDQGELLKFLKCFLYYSLKATNKKVSIQNIRSLDQSIQDIIQPIVKDFKEKENSSAAPTPTPSPAPSPMKSSPPPQQQDDESAEKIAALDKEIQELTNKKESIDREIEQYERQLQIHSSANKSEDMLADARRRHANAKEKNEKLHQKLDETENLLNDSRNELDELRKQKQKLLNPEQIQQSEKSNTELKQQLDKVQAEILAELSTDSKLAAQIEKNPPKTSEDFINLLNIRALETEIATLQQDLQTMKSQQTLHEAELSALTQNLENQNKKAAETLRKKIAQLNSEIDKSPIGEAKRLSLKYIRVIKKLESEVEQLASSCSDMEVEELTRQLTLMATRKATEGDLLARKQSLMQATAEQCDVRLQRLKLNIDLQMHSARITRWKNCFAPSQK